MAWYKDVIETELNSCNDNPIVDLEHQQILHGGHFYGGHIAMVMDSMKTQVANLADLFDRQFALLVDPKFNRGLPANLTASNASNTHHGLKAVQIAVSAWTAEALKLTMPASVFSRSTECHNQDKVSMGTIAARDCLRIIELTEQCTAALLLAVHHALALRLRSHSGAFEMSDEWDAFLEKFPLLEEDRALDISLQSIIDGVRKQSIY